MMATAPRGGKAEGEWIWESGDLSPRGFGGARGREFPNQRLAPRSAAPVIQLVLGGARSGKSAVAERMASHLAAPVTYLATAALAGGDAGFEARVAAHRRRRPEDWRTVEASGDLVAAVKAGEGTLLIDALGTWVAGAEGFTVDVVGLCSALADHHGDVVVVSDEVGLGLHPSSEMGCDFRDALGLVNQAVAEVADDVVVVIAGRVLRLDRW